MLIELCINTNPHQSGQRSASVKKWCGLTLLLMSPEVLEELRECVCCCCCKQDAQDAGTGAGPTLTAPTATSVRPAGRA